METLSTEDYDYFRTRGFELVKSTSGKYYIRPTVAITHARVLEARVAAQKCGFVFDMNENVINYIKPTKDVGREI